MASQWRCRKIFPLGVNLHSKHDHRKPLTKEIALALAVADPGITESVHGVPFDPTPVSIGRVEVGWLFEFAPVEPFNEDGRKVYHSRCVVDDVDRRVHCVGTSGVKRVVERIKSRRG